MKEDRFSPKRMIRMLGILISVAIYSVFLAIICKFTIDRVLVLVFINALYLPLLIAVIEMERIRGHLNRNEKVIFISCFFVFLQQQPVMWVSFYAGIYGTGHDSGHDSFLWRK